ncbi:helix-hairpin-helix domain-containing protein [Roseovarius autotrophicus]|uniref:helix-hairpin-helix domain-containing protein n=1 Tax=Roseovarius autotrophicus TaxID=2824121 RepID=UPI001A036AF5|nr:helix-hairpin-helix domain-containing protein [Roseovarius autotrophicus]MBE0453318.1 helix-hairpin-helix domain-containing protein [Roseovarius sp.]
MSTLEDIGGIGPALRRALEDLGISDPAALAAADAATLTQVRGISPERAARFIAEAQTFVSPSVATAPDAAPAKAKGKTKNSKKDRAGKKGKADKDGKKNKKKDKDRKARSGKKKKG